ncbi:MAG TPA: Gfo/Idh/MocA family oxidoreductase [Solirubrobacteraceae bacterium]
MAELGSLPRRRFARAAGAEPLGVAVVGYGYWGPNLARNVAESPDMRLHALCERDAVRGSAFSQRFPGVPVREELDQLLDDPGVDAVLVATPPATHHALVKRALEAGKHVLVEKPLATTSADAYELVELARREDLVLMPGHTFVYSPAVNTIRSLLTEGVIGDVYFVTSARMNLGKYQRDGVVTDLAPHDLSILMYWLDEPVVSVTTTACTVFQEGVPETAFMTLAFASGTTANIQVSWLAPRKVRQMVVVGSKRMVQYDDAASDEPVRIYDRGMDVARDAAPANFGEYQLTYRSGDVVIPRIDAHEPLSLELADFAHAIRTGSVPRSNAALGLEIVSVIEAAETSMRRNGAPIVLEPARARVAA